MSEYPEEEKIRRFLNLQQRQLDLKAQLTEVFGELNTLKQEVNTLIHAAADRHLVDEQGQPANGVVYWYAGLGIVRLGSLVDLVPLQRMNGYEVFGAPPPADEKTNGKVKVQ